jgi:chromosome segregation ATPase
MADGSTDNSAKKAKKLKTAHSTVVGSTNSLDDSEMIMNYEKRIAEMLMTIQKQERDILYKDEEIKSIKNIARDLAEELEPVKKREEDLKQVILERDEALERIHQEMEELARQLRDESLHKNKITDVQLEFEARIDKKEVQIHSLKEEVVKYRDEIRGKDEAIKALSMTLIEKGKENQRLTEMVVEIKNHQLVTQILGQKFHVHKQGALRNEELVFRFIHDKSREQEYFLEISSQKG